MSEELSALLSLEDIEKLTALDEARTQGEWLVTDGGGQLSYSPAHVVVRAKSGTPWFICDMQDDLDEPGVGGDPLENAAFIAAIANAAPSLLRMAKSYASIRAGEDELVGRLREHADDWQQIGDRHPAYADARLLADLRQAADTISALRGEVEYHESFGEGMEERLQVEIEGGEKDRADLKRIEEALEPFADALGEPFSHDDFPDDARVFMRFGRTQSNILCLGDLRRAANLYAALRASASVEECSPQTHDDNDIAKANVGEDR